MVLGGPLMEHAECSPMGVACHTSWGWRPKEQQREELRRKRRAERLLRESGLDKT